MFGDSALEEDKVVGAYAMDDVGCIDFTHKLEDANVDGCRGLQDSHAMLMVDDEDFASLVGLFDELPYATNVNVKDFDNLAYHLDVHDANM